jgi:hypothetical protein
MQYLPTGVLPVRQYQTPCTNKLLHINNDFETADTRVQCSEQGLATARLAVQIRRMIASGRAKAMGARRAASVRRV